jgi:tRNA nucleotidyltransferase (CCA-adding enzyme)
VDVVVLKDIFTKPIEIIKKLVEHGHQAYVVGGAIRDLLMDRSIGDVDISTSARPDQIIKLFPKTIPVGIEHGTVIVLMGDTPYEVTTFRKDEQYLDYRRPTSVSFIDSLTEDLKRRDFTINAMAMDLDGKLFDPFNGQAAINRKLIQTVGIPTERFSEDALRMMRAIRFHSQLSFEIEGGTIKAMEKHASLLKHVSVERISVELEKVLSGPSCQSAMHLFSKAGLSMVVPALSPYRNRLLEWPALSYPTIQTKTERWAILCSLLKVKEKEQFLKSWKLPTKVIKEASTIVEALEKIEEDMWTDYLIYKLGKELTLSTERLYSILCGLPVEERVKARLLRYNLLPITSKSDLVLNGHDIIQIVRKKPGPWINETVTTIEKAILQGSLKNTKESIKEWLISCNQL